MPKLNLKESAVMDAAKYGANVVAIEPDQGSYGPQLRWTFHLPAADAFLTAWCTTTYSPRSKLGTWVENILGELPDSLDTDDLIDRACTLDVIVSTRADGSEFNKVVGVYPASPSKTDGDEEIPF